MFHHVILRSAGGILILGLLTLSLPEWGEAAGQPPVKKVREEEEEPAKSKVPTKINEIDPKDPPAGNRQPPVQGNFNIAQEAARAKKPQVRDFLLWLSIPYDNLVAATGTSYRIALFPERRLPDGKFKYFELNATLVAGKEKELATSAGFSLQPYEEIVMESVDKFLLRKIDGFSREEMTELSIQVLQATRRFHAFAIEQKKRVGKDWEPVDEKMRKRIIQLRREQLQLCVAAKDWKKADELSLELSNYSDDAEAQKDVYRLLLQKVILHMNPDHDEDYFKVRDALNQFENIAGGRGEPIAAAARKKLSDRAQYHVERARRLAREKDNVEAFRALKAAETLDAELAGIGELRSSLRGRILYVGVPRLPEFLTPARARSDSERWGTELLFESLLQAVPDQELGRRYRPMLAASLPGLVPLGREFTLARDNYWVGVGENRQVDARDVFGTLELLRKFPSLPCAEGLDILDTDKLRIEDPFRMRLSFHRGTLEPLSKMTFKVLPARYLKARNKEINDDEFARKPFGSGPYTYKGRDSEGLGRDVAVFPANTRYTQRPGKLGLPNIPEIRFVVPKLSGAGADIASGQLHLVLDVPASDLPRYVDDPQAAGLMKAHKTQINRRIWILALNHRNPALQNVSLRRAISAAIDREKILNTEQFRPGGNKSYHTALTGPFPLQSWATPEKARKPDAALFNRDLASGLFTDGVGRERVRLSLKFPIGDNQAAGACEKIQQQIEDASKKSPDAEPAVKITLDPVAADAFIRDVEHTQTFDLAYVPLDFKDDLYSLSGLFDPSAAGPDGRNYMGYLANGGNAEPDDTDLRISIDAIRAHRDFRDRIREETWKVHTKFLSRMPFVPLWQLDRFVVVHRSLDLFLDNPSERIDPERLDPATIFTGVELWRLK